MKTILCAVPLLLVLVLAGCYNNLRIDRKLTPGADFSQYRTWSFGRQGEYPMTGNATFDNPAFRDSIGENTIEAMKKRGYTHVDTNPDLLLMLHVAVEPGPNEAKENPAYDGYDLDWSQDEWQEGSLMLFVVDARTLQQVWSSTATAALDPEAATVTRIQRFNAVVTRMLEDLPHAAK